MMPTRHSITFRSAPKADFDLRSCDVADVPTTVMPFGKVIAGAYFPNGARANASAASAQHGHPMG
jgi:hypothetical protein